MKQRWLQTNYPLRYIHGKMDTTVRRSAMVGRGMVAANDRLRMHFRRRRIVRRKASSTLADLAGYVCRDFKNIER
jgi:hypothetical protein